MFWSFSAFFFFFFFFRRLRLGRVAGEAPVVREGQRAQQTRYHHQEEHYDLEHEDCHRAAKLNP